MDGLGMPYEVVRVDRAAAQPLNFTQLLWNPDGSARYAGYFMAPNLEAIGVLNKSDVLTLWDFQLRTGARSARFGVWPGSIGFAANLASCNAEDRPMTFSAAATTVIGASGINPSATLGNEGLWRCPFAKASATGSCPICAADFAGDCLNPSCTATQVLDFAGGATAGGALVKYADGRESLAFIFDCAAFSPTCMVLGHLSLSWLLHDIIPGQRDVLLTVHQ
ncbi:hypothetical protein MNEG_10048 [Monoraphidium neglectum]|uniref:Agd3 CBM87 domain-containing protein n=1 Tax=Monoraphidium neglectum TaxID=145388 RepID=A0A0D2JEB1_9CHLO|nr:hypothetical protein MNEG_10048 [Monoraphidium neglectum]KIY97912.1 hypothetical protein MNEG_10048 [Monoraphidium neglectum]|eukprot:XP_013896932.1 hypothetical protein MNEG_10048 [Monoraphidium neglectum]